MRVKSAFYAVFMLGTLQCTAQLTENFNSRPGIATADVRGYLQSRCWTLINFEPGSAESAIEGDGTLASRPAADSRRPSGIYSPVLDIRSDGAVSFAYRLSKEKLTKKTDWLKLYLASENNEPVFFLDSIAVSVSPKASIYKRQFSNLHPGSYRLFIQYSNQAGSQVLIDQLQTSFHFHYSGGCNSAPVAQDDMVNADKHGAVKVDLSLNDADRDNDSYSVRIETAPQGSLVKLVDKHTITFTPAAGFEGNSARLTYRLCEDQAGGLCSEPATVIIKYKPTLRASSLVNIRGEYLLDGKINLSITRNPARPVARYAIERSLDGKEWTNAGVLDVAKLSPALKAVVFTDALHKNTVIKNDIFYRVREQLDGQDDLVSKLLVVRVYNTPGVRMVSVTPNPAENDLNVTLQLNRDAITSMKVFREDGVEVMRKVVRASSGLNNIVLEGTSELAAGPYTLDMIINSKERMLVSLVKD